MSNFVGLQLKIAAMKKISLLLFSAMLVLASCDKMPSKMYNDYFENDFTISDIEMKSAVVSYVAHYPQDTDGYSFKVLVSEDPTPTKDNSREYSCTTSDRKNYSASITGLWGGKTYYCRPCVWQGIYTYGPIKSFKTEEWAEKAGTIGQAVDLGLSVLWADHNVGASSPSEIGGFYAWAETGEKNEDYWWDNYKYAYGELLTDSWNYYRLVSKYCDTQGYGQVDNKLTLESCDDAASVKWGNGWFTPTGLQWMELIDNCTVEASLQNGIKVYVLTSKVNGNHITLPGGGILMKNQFESPYSENGYYWTADVRQYDARTANIADVGEYGINLPGTFRCYGCQVRPVRSK